MLLLTKYTQKKRQTQTYKINRMGQKKNRLPKAIIKLLINSVVCVCVCVESSFLTFIFPFHKSDITPSPFLATSSLVDYLLLFYLKFHFPFPSLSSFLPIFQEPSLPFVFLPPSSIADWTPMDFFPFHTNRKNISPSHPLQIEKNPDSDD